MLNFFAIYTAMGPDEMYPKVLVLRELADEVAKLTSMVFEKSWQSGKVPMEWRKGNTTFKKGRKEDLGSYQTVSLTSMPGKTME